MIIAIKKVGQEIEYLDLLSVGSNEIKSLLKADVVATFKVNEHINGYYNAVVDMEAPINFILLEEEGILNYEAKGVMHGDVIFTRDELKSLVENDVSYLTRNYMKNTAKSEKTKEWYDTLEINCDLED